MSTAPLAVRSLAPEDLGRVVDTFGDAFRDYPVMRFVVGDAPDYDVRLRMLLTFFVSARTLRGEPLFGVEADGSLAAAAICSYPGSESPPALAVLREATWAALGDEARSRYDACGTAWAPLTVDAPHVHLNMIGVRHAWQKRGLSRRLLERVHRLAEETPGATGVTLSTEVPANVGLYEHMGYRVLGHARIAPTLETWGMFRSVDRRPR